MAHAGEKRSAEVAGPWSLGRLPESLEEACAFVTTLLGESNAGDAVSRMREEDIDGEVLSSMSEDELKEKLGITKFGLRRKLHINLAKLAASSGQQVGLGGGAVCPLTSAPSSLTAMAAPVPPRPALTPVPFPSLASPPKWTAQGLPVPCTPATVSLPTVGSETPCTEGNSVAANGAVPVASQPPTAPAALVGDNVVGGEGAAHGGDAGGVGGPPSLSLAEHPNKAVGPTAEEIAAEEMEADSVIEKVLAAEGECLVLCKWVMKQMRKKLTRPRLSNWAENEVKQSKEMELEKLEADSLAPQGMTVVVVGNTGQGKSTMLNSLIGERNVLPTNGMRACTAALVELTYLRREREDQVAYVGEVEFISVESWEQELDVLFEKLTQQDGRAILNLNNSELAGYESWCKVMAVYGTSYSHSRIREGRTYVPPLVSELRRKLKHERAITRLLGTTQRIEAPDAATFRRKIQRYVDSSNDPNEQSFWPIIKMVRMKSSNWKVLKTGAKLVDAPGLRDDNMARNNMVQNYFKEADSIWIVSDIKRAVNDKTAKDMLGESFRRQMLMDGQFGSMIFIATQSDNLLRSEIAKNLDLGEDTALDACARKRNEFTKQRIQEDFLDGLEDMERNSSGSQRSREELRQRFHLPVFTVSGIDFQKLSGVRKGDGGPKVWRSPEDTEIPALRRYVHGAALQMRRVAMRKKAEAVEQFCDSMCVLLADDGAASKATRDRAKQAFHEAVNKRAAAAVIENVQHFRKAVDGFFGSAIGDQLTLGANSATNEVMNKVRSWGLKPGEGGMYWSTYKASLRRDGVWNRNMNEEMAEPVYRAVATQWEEIMTRNLQAEFDLIQRNGERLVESTHAEFREKLVQLNLVEAASRFDGLAKSIKQRCVSNIRNAVDAAKNAGRSQQREVSRAITPAIQEQMRPAYASGMEPSGPGSHACRKQIVESYVDKRRGQMFHLAVKPVTAGLNEMKETIVTAVEQGFKSLATEMKVGCSPLWSTTNAAMVEVRAELGPEVRSIKNEATKALWKLMRAQGLEVTEPDVNDDDIEDVTAAARVAVEEVDLTAEGASMPEADPVPFLTKVKQERPHAAT